METVNVLELPVAATAISLVAMISLGVLERGREIGVIRALGARPRTVAAIFLVEGGAVAFFGVSGGGVATLSSCCGDDTGESLASALWHPNRSNDESASAPTRTAW